MILDDVDILINLWNLLVLVEQSDLKIRLAGHIRIIDAFGCENSL